MVASDSPIDRPFAQTGDRAACFARGVDSAVCEQRSPAPANQAVDQPPRGDADEPDSSGQRRAAIHRRLVAEHEPVGMLEEFQVKQLADQIADHEELTAARQAAIQVGTTLFGEFAGFVGPNVPHQAPSITHPDDETTAARLATDQAIVGAMTSPLVTRIERRIERAQKQILQISTYLGKLQASRRLGDLPRLAAFAGVTINLDSHPAEPPSALPRKPASEARPMEVQGESRGRWAAAETEADCERIFRDWLRGAGLACPQCESRKQAQELSNRLVLQCRSCGGQRGLRHGTFLAHSNVGFLAAVRTVRLLAHDPRVPVPMLCQVTGLSRRSIRGFRSRILEALEDPARRSSLLAACGWQPEQVPST